MRVERENRYRLILYVFVLSVGNYIDKTDTDYPSVAILASVQCLKLAQFAARIMFTKSFNFSFIMRIQFRDAVNINNSYDTEIL